ncbi:poly(A) polymerase [Clostridium tetanomorphum DSM 665]|uniref:HD domain-containing protein n=2 Tax=Clostridium tetanomorphum TaxID=1553 RepID=A0A923IYY1_CLOTT|nr:HD domain-containing protein [Clostridium tetanomorphum]KAJ52610.1 poly(A) polymerase [Clostridium tetanomorphum DSM 665]MBC2396836.1 HD domain-containing protein [Clostridium tetanomorphum]SQB92311.1 poly(A) polymerase [Clostridium tetanomorphum]
MNKHMKIHIPKSVELIINTLEEHNHEAYIVGGCVRDSILNKTPNDWDVTTNAKAEQVEKIFKNRGFKVIETGIKHGTVTIIIDNVGYEVTTYRIDGEYLDGRHPDKVEFTSSLKEDLSRRDFTINAIAYNHTEGIVDYFEGIKDLKNKVITCVGDPLKRFSEDALRMMRAVRFSAQLDFKIEYNTEDAIKSLSDNIKFVSMERIKEEFDKILLSDNVDKIRNLNCYGLMTHFLPEYNICEVTPQNNPYHIFDVGIHLIRSVENIEKNLYLKLTMLLHDICKPQCKTTDELGIDHFYVHGYKSAEKAREILKRMKYDNKTIEKVYTLIEYHDHEVYSNKSIRKLLNKIGEELFWDLLKVKEADIKAQNPKFYEERHKRLLEVQEKLNNILQKKQCFSLKDLAINGKDLIQLGLAQGKEIGKILNELLEKVIENPELNTREKLINIIKDKEDINM